VNVRDGAPATGDAPDPPDRALPRHVALGLAALACSMLPFALGATLALVSAFSGSPGAVHPDGVPTILDRLNSLSLVVPPPLALAFCVASEVARRRAAKAPRAAPADLQAKRREPPARAAIVAWIVTGAEIAFLIWVLVLVPRAPR